MTRLSGDDPRYDVSAMKKSASSTPSSTTTTDAAQNDNGNQTALNGENKLSSEDLAGNKSEEAGNEKPEVVAVKAADDEE